MCHKRNTRLSKFYKGIATLKNFILMRKIKSYYVKSQNGFLKENELLLYKVTLRSTKILLIGI
jgi:hypothetical protein